MKHFIAAVFVAVLAGGTALPVHAQLSPGTSGYSSAPIEGTQRDYWYLVRQLGHCLSSSKKDEAVTFLSTVPGSRAEGAAWDDLFNNGRSNNPCMQTFVSASIVRAHVRGAMAESMFERHVEDMDGQFSPIFDEPETVASIHDFADCFVARHYDTAHNLVEVTKISSRGELRFIREIVSEFGPCLPQGRDVEIVATDVRLAISEALYRTTITDNGDNESVGGSDA
ncbi:MAG: hypothetical protein ABJN35_03600 [Erythrobacter sp.]